MKKSIWKVNDRRGIHYFENRPHYHSGHECFFGDFITVKNENKYRIIKRFESEVVGLLVIKGLYPKRFKVSG